VETHERSEGKPDRVERAEKREEKPTPNGAVKPAANGAVAPFVIERLTHQDILDICALYKRVWEPFLTGLPAEVQKEWQPTPLEFTSRMEGVTYFAAKRDNRLVGAIGCALEDGAVRLLNFAVEQEFRRHGIGTALVHSAIEWARHNNARSLWVDQLIRFKDAAPLFKQLGFQETGVLHRHFFGEDVRLFEMLP
jgi:GNAT superfamily N-acetyltransferase